MFYLIIGSNLIMVLIFLLKLKALPPQIPLFFSRPWGEAQLVDTWTIFFLLFLLNIFYFFNNYFYKKFFSDNLLVKKIIEYFNLFLIVGFTYVFLKIIFLVS